MVSYKYVAEVPCPDLADMIRLQDKFSEDMVYIYTLFTAIFQYLFHDGSSINICKGMKKRMNKVMYESVNQVKYRNNVPYRG